MPGDSRGVPGIRGCIAAGIAIPFPHRTLYFGEKSKAFEVLLNGEGDVH